MSDLERSAAIAEQLMHRHVRMENVERLCGKIEDHVRGMRLGSETERAVCDLLDDLLHGLETAVDINYVLEVNE